MLAAVDRKLDVVALALLVDSVWPLAAEVDRGTIAGLNNHAAPPRINSMFESRVSCPTVQEPRRQVGAVAVQVANQCVNVRLRQFVSDTDLYIRLSRQAIEHACRTLYPTPTEMVYNQRQQDTQRSDRDQQRAEAETH